MYNNPFFNNFRQNEPQQPIQNIINTQMPSQDLFMARYLNENENVDEIFINHKTAFISLKNGKLIIKETNGNKTEYDLILPKDEKDLKIDALERQIIELKGMITNEQLNTNVPTSNEIKEPDGNDKKHSKK